MVQAFDVLQTFEVGYVLFHIHLNTSYEHMKNISFVIRMCLFGQ